MQGGALATVMLATVLAGCATVERGVKDQIYVVTDPPGAKVTVSTGDATCITPCNLDVNRVDAVTVAVAKPGYNPQQVDVKTQSIAADAATSRDLTLDYVGRYMDYKGGANLIHVPNPVTFKLTKVGTPG